MGTSYVHNCLQNCVALRCYLYHTHICGVICGSQISVLFLSVSFLSISSNLLFNLEIFNVDFGRHPYYATEASSTNPQDIIIFNKRSTFTASVIAPGIPLVPCVQQLTIRFCASLPTNIRIRTFDVTIIFENLDDNIFQKLNSTISIQSPLSSIFGSRFWVLTLI